MTFTGSLTLKWSSASLNESMRLYLEKHRRLPCEIDANRHFIHIQPSNPHIPQADPKIHIVIDLEMEKHSGRLSPEFPHEFFRVRRNGTDLYVLRVVGNRQQKTKR